jgi:hypothetical protein
MDEAALIAALEDGTLAPAEFTHANHVRTGWFYLRQLPLREAAHQFRDVLQAYVTRLGAQDKFHLTLTLAFMHLIHVRMRAEDEAWVSFAVRNTDLLSDAKSLIGQHYSATRLDAGQKDFAEPDLAPLPE